MRGGPLVCVVTPSLNSAATIAETLDSVLTQDYPQLEYFVVDGGSTDGTIEILCRYERRLHWVSEPDTGQSSAVNKGWQEAAGEIIGWLNADDLYRPGAVRAAVDALAADPTATGVYGECDYINTAGTAIGRYPTGPDAYSYLIRGQGNAIPQPTVFLRRDVVRQVGWLDESLQYVMDLDYWLRVGLRHRLAYIPQTLASLRLHGEAKSVRAAAQFGPELISVYERFFARPDLPAPVRSLEPHTLSNVCYEAAHHAFWAHDVAGARRHALRAWRHSRRNVRRMLFVAWGLGTLGEFGIASARMLRHLLRTGREPWRPGTSP